jgi:hypothetical protein
MPLYVTTLFMRKPILIACLILFFVACNQPENRAQVEKEIAGSFQKETGYAPKEVRLIREGDHSYTGYVTLQKDNSKALIEVSLDKDDPSRYTWKMTEPSPTMLNDQAKRLLRYETVPGAEQFAGTADSSGPAPVAPQEP